MKIKITYTRARTLTPFAYHSLMVQSGTATLPELISDRAIAFGTASALGMLSASVALPEMDYKKHLSAMPFRTSVFLTDEPKLLQPLTRRCNLDEEAGYKEKIRNVTYKGNLQSFFHIQEVPHDQVFHGVFFGFDNFDPFDATEDKKNLVIRIGLHRNGMLLLEKKDQFSVDNIEVRLNMSTAHLFGKKNMPMERYCLHSLQLSPLLKLKDASKEVETWL